MHRHLPPIAIDGFDHPHALTGIAEARRPAWAVARCATCSGRGARNALLHPDTMRCRIEACGDCDGSGWRSGDGSRHHQTIETIDGQPCWVARIVPPPVAAAVALAA